MLRVVFYKTETGRKPVREGTEAGENQSSNAGRNESMTTDAQHVGSDFDEYLKEEGIYEEVERVAVKRAVALQVNQFMSNQGLSKTEMARRMRTSRASLDRLLDPENGSVTLQTLERAARVLGRRLHITLI